MPCRFPPLLSLLLFATLTSGAPSAIPGLAAPPGDSEIPWVRGRIALPVGGTVELELAQPSSLPRLELGASRLYESLPLADELWRTEFDLVMRMTAPRDVLVAGRGVPAGTYALYIFPGEETWTFHLIPEGDLMGMPQRDPQTGEVVQLFVPSRQVRSFTVEPEPAEVTSLRLMGEHREDGGVDLILRARRAEVRVAFE